MRAGWVDQSRKNTMNKTIRVVVADDHSSIRAGVRRLLDGVPRMSVVGEAADTQALAELLDTCRFDVVVTDIGMPGLEGESNVILFLRKVLRHAPGLPVIVLTMIHQPRTLIGLLHLGVTAIVDKRDAMGSLIEAVDSAFAGRRYLSLHVRDAIDEADWPQPGAGVLSAREWEVFKFYIHGLTIGQIAERLGRSSKTISTQKRNAMRKLGLDTENDLIQYALQIGLT